MTSSALPLEYLIDAIAELELGSDARVRFLDEQNRELGKQSDQSDPRWEGERKVWRRRTEHVAAVAHALLAAEVAPLTAGDDHPLPRAEELVGALVGAARCRHLDSGSSADAVFSS